MGFLFSRKGSIISESFKLVEKHGHLSEDIMYDIALYDSYLSIKIPLGKNDTTLQYNQITDVEYGSKKEIVEKNKSVIGRAVAGGLIFGGLGAVVGAVSGTGVKQKKELHFYFVISYKSSDGTDKYMVFEDTRNYKGFKLCNKLKELCNIKSQGDVAL